MLTGTIYLGQIHDEVVGVGLPGCFDDVFHSGFISPITNVLCNRGSKQDWLLLNNTNLWAQPPNIKGANVMTIQSNLQNHMNWNGKPVSAILVSNSDFILLKSMVLNEVIPTSLWGKKEWKERIESLLFTL